VRPFLSRLVRVFRQRYEPVGDPRELVAGDRVELRGRAEPIDGLLDPLEERAAVAVEYRAWPPSTTVGVDGATAHNNRAFEVRATQAVDFVLDQGGAQVLVKVQRGEDVAERHMSLLEHYGVALRAETEIIEVGAELVVHGRVQVGFDAGASPHRSDPWAAVVRADRFWRAG
jgi:hypothetical protein